MEELGVLVARTQSGDLEAYGEIVRRFQDMAYGYGYSILGDFSAGEDAAQESFIQAYKELSGLREPDAFPGWFRRIVYTQCAMIARRNHVPTVPLDDVAEVPSAVAGPHELAEQSEMRDRVLGAIRALPENERVVTALFYINGYSHNDIAGFLEVPASTVKSRLHTARKQLKKRMVDMVSESLHSSRLPEDFGSRTLDNLKSALASPARKKTIRSGHWFPELTRSLRWQVLLSQHLVLHYYHDAVHSQAFAGELLDVMERLYTQVTEFLIHPPRSKQERISVQGRCSCFIVHTDSARTFGTLEDSNTLFYLMDPERYPEYPSRLRHEIAHLVWGRLYGEAPPLFTEGLAVYAEHMSAPDADLGSLLAHDTMLPDDIPPLVEIVDDAGFWKYGPFYGVGGVFVHYLVESYGWDALRRFFLASDYDDPNALRHFAEVYGRDLISVDSDWRDYVRARTI